MANDFAIGRSASDQGTDLADVIGDLGRLNPGAGIILDAYG